MGIVTWGPNATTPALIAACTGLDLTAGSGYAEECTQDGAPSSANAQFTLEASESQKVALGFVLPLASGVTISGGDYVVRVSINDDLGGNSVFVTDIYICHEASASGPTIAGLGYLNGLEDYLVNGVMAWTVPGCAQVTESGGSVIIITIAMTNREESSSTITITTDQVMDSPGYWDDAILINPFS